MNVRVAPAVAVAIAVSLVGCGSGDDEPAASASVAGGDEDGDDRGDDGTETEGPGAGAAVGSDRPDSVREDFLIPIMAGWEVDIQGEIGLTNMSGAQLLYPNDAYDDIVAFYDDWFGSQPGEFVRSESDGRVFFQLVGDSIYQVNVLPDHEERDQKWVAVQASGGG